jgi:hypothetical protein
MLRLTQKELWWSNYGQTKGDDGSDTELLSVARISRILEN